MSSFDNCIAGSSESTQSMVSADQKASRVRLPSAVPLLEDDNDTDSFIYEDDGESNDDDSNSQLCVYVQKVEKEKRELENEMQLLRDRDTSQATKLHATERRIEMLEASLKDAFNASDAYKKEKDVILTLHASERERMASLVALLEEAQTRYEDAERARQSAVFKLSSLQAARADASIKTLLSPASSVTRTTAANTTASAFRHETLDFGERIEKYKREIELLRQRLALAEEQATERQKMAVSLALHEAQLDYSNVIEHMRLECDRRLNEWRHEEALRARETESAMDEDRYSIRLEMKHALQRAQIDQRVAYLQAHTNRAANMPGSVESDFSIGTLDEVLVRMQLDQLRTRRFEALKKTLLIRSAKQNQAAKELFCRWKIQASNTKILRLNAVLHMHRIALHLDTRKKLGYFSKWRAQVREIQTHQFQAQALSCWNRMIAVERIRHVIEQTTVKRTASYFHRWHELVNKTTDGAAKSDSTKAEPDEGSLQSLQEEIKKLHDQLASSKSEAWGYKRQLLKQFLH